MLNRLTCALVGHLDQWPHTCSDGVTRVICQRCSRASVGVALRDGLAPPRILEARPDSRVVMFRQQARQRKG
jgi:hypothetical protein